MEALVENIKIKANKKFFVKDPETSILGKKILQYSILLIDEIGFENFTFKKLGDQIGSNESSIYRYFENKHKLLVYLSGWYWTWMEYKLVLATTNIINPQLKLEKAIAVVTENIEDDLSTKHIDEAVLNKIIIAEFTKILHTKELDIENKNGFFIIYKRVINRIVNIVHEVNPEYPFAKSLVSTVVDGALHQHFIKDHLKSITNCSNDVSPADFYIDLVKRTLK